MACVHAYASPLLAESRKYGDGVRLGNIQVLCGLNRDEICTINCDRSPESHKYYTWNQT